MKKMFSLILAAITILCSLGGCAAPSDQSDLAYVQGKGKLIIGITEYAPMDYKDANGNWTGFDAEFARLFAQELGVEAEFHVIADWGKKFMELDTKQIDAVWNGMTITEEATANSSVSDPYVINAQVVVMKSNIVGNYTTTDSLSGLTIAVEDGQRHQWCNRDPFGRPGSRTDGSQSRHRRCLRN